MFNFRQKICPILYPLLEKLTTNTTITHKHNSKKRVRLKVYLLQVLKKLVVEQLLQQVNIKIKKTLKEIKLKLMLTENQREIQLLRMER